MPTIKQQTVIPKSVSNGDDLDFHYLKKIGIEYIQSIGGNLWTDFNKHDPGVTFLDMLCYVITDLGNRINLPIEHLLSTEDNAGFDKQFYTAEDILPTRPVTELDYRKLFIDIDGVRNCWLYRHERKVYVDCRENRLSYNPNAFNTTRPEFKRDFQLKGLYDILIDFDIPEDIVPGSSDYLNRAAVIKQSVRNRYHANRNLCEDLVDVKEIGTQDICICADIELERNADEEKVHAQVLFAIQEYFSPSLNFYTLKEMLDRGYRTDEIFEGPKLSHGFIDTEELRNSSLRTQVRLSDIMNIISSIAGVKVIRDISITKCNEEIENDWLVCMDPRKRPVLCKDSIFSYRKDVLQLVLQQSDVEKHLKDLRDQRNLNRTIAADELKIPLPEGKYLDTDWYTTMQNDFPDIYGIGRYGLPSTASVARKSQAKQLKAYLLFFDQVLASYFAQLGVVRELLSIDSDLKRTYYTQAVQDIACFKQLVPEADYPQDPELLSAELLGAQDPISERRNELLDHLLARFAEKFSEYTFLMKELYGTASTELVVNAKRAFLNDYRGISRNRGGAFNYYRQTPSQLWNTDNVSGAEVRIARLAGFRKDDFRRRDLSDSYVELYTPEPAEEPEGEQEEQETIYRWRIYDDHNNIVLTATENYHSDGHAEAELYLSVLHIIQTPESAVLEAYENDAFTDGQEIGNLMVCISPEGDYSFNVLNPTAENPDYIIARQYSYYANKEDFRDAMLDMIRFMKTVFSEEGLFIVEHILLRPDVTDMLVPSEDFYPVSLNDCVECDCIDPYSYRVSVVLPGFVQRFANMHFRDFLEQLIREELPAHIMPKICWIGERRGVVPDEKNDLMNFEKTFRDFLLARTNLEQGHPTTTLKAFNTALTELNTIYPEGRLHDCESNDPYGKIILGRTNLGTLNSNDYGIETN